MVSLPDNTDTYTAAATDAMNYHVTGSTGTSISISFTQIYGKYQHFDNTPIQQRKQKYNSFGG
jgi:hypothetical protein